jgi:hypothetical protein
MTKRDTKNKDIDTENTNKFNIKLDEEHIGWLGTKPFVCFDENWVQMSLTRTKLQIPREHTTRMTYLSWWSGFIAGARGQEGLKTLLIITLILVLILGGMTYFFHSETRTAIAGLNYTIQNVANHINTITMPSTTNNITVV